MFNVGKAIALKLNVMGTVDKRAKTLLNSDAKGLVVHQKRLSGLVNDSKVRPVFLDKIEMVHKVTHSVHVPFHRGLWK